MLRRWRERWFRNGFEVEIDRSSLPLGAALSAKLCDIVLPDTDGKQVRLGTLVGQCPVRGCVSPSLPYRTSKLTAVPAAIFHPGGGVCATMMLAGEGCGGASGAACGGFAGGVGCAEFIGGAAKVTRPN